MKTKSAKAKARRLQDWVTERLLEYYTELEKGDVRPAIMGESGEDIKQSPAARNILPFSFECKNQERLNIWSAINQAEENCPENQKPAVVFKRNRSDVYVTLKFNDLLNLLKKNS